MTANKAINEAVRRLVQRYRPEKIILFGSRARGTAREHSDYDLLVILPIPDKHYWDVIGDMYSLLYGVTVAIDIVVRSPDQCESRRAIIGTIEHLALEEGEVLYERAASPLARG